MIRLAQLLLRGVWKSAKHEIIDFFLIELGLATQTICVVARDPGLDTRVWGGFRDCKTTYFFWTPRTKLLPT